MKIKRRMRKKALILGEQRGVIDPSFY